jgi:hypothetical protein
MPYLTDLIHGGTGLLRTGEGILTGMEMVRGAKVALNLNADLSRVNHSVIDFSKVARFEVTQDELEVIVWVAGDNISRLGHAFCIAIVAPDDEIFERCQAFNLINKRPDATLQIFRDLPQAMAWLHLVVPIP